MNVVAGQISMYYSFIKIFASKIRGQFQNVPNQHT